MQSSLWNYFSGYVIISVKGFSWEKFVNKAVSTGINIWDIKCFADRTEMKIPLKECGKLRDCALKSGCRVKILEEHGAPFLFRRLRKKGFFMWGLLVFVSFLFILSSFIWEVRVKGALRIPEEDILSFAAECGIFPGAGRKNIDTDEAARKFILNFDEISWISIDIQGTRAEISIAEALEEKEPPVRSAPSNIVADRSGVIDRIYVSSGTPEVFEGDTVFEGDILISGIPLTPVDGEFAHGEPVPAAGKVFARNTYSITLTLPKTRWERVFTGESMNLYTLILPGKEFSLPTFSKEEKPFEITDSKEKRLSFGDYSFPFGFKKETISFYEEKTLVYTENEAENILNNRLLYKLSGLDAGTKILNLTSDFSETPDSFVLKTELTVSESIGKEENF
ncbi:MAG: sporulation protein YqfD [Firmicutes bacterium]|nr:sporulation protein YqfD [Bacillota bacterium]